MNAVLSAGTPSFLADHLGLLNQIVRSQRQQIQSMATARTSTPADKQALDAIVAQQAQQDADLGVKKTEIETTLAQLHKLRQQVVGSGGGANSALKPVACPVEYATGPGGTAAKKACDLIGKPTSGAPQAPTATTAPA